MSKRLETIPSEDGFRMPGEFEPHRGTYIIWPERPDNWRLGAKPAQEVFAKLANTIIKYEECTMVVSKAQYQNSILPSFLTFLLNYMSHICISNNTYL